MAGSTHETDAINFSEQMIKTLRSPRGARYVMHHNHPGGRSLSVMDLATLAALPGIRNIVAHGTQDRTYSASLTAEMQEQRAEMGNAFPNRLRTVADMVDDRLYPVVNKFVKDGQLTAERAELVHTDLRGRALHEAGVIEYQTTFAETDAAWYREARAAAVQGAIDGRKTFFPDSPLRRDDRRSADLRRPQELGKVLARSGKDTQRRGDDQVRAPPSRKDDRVEEGRGLREESGLKFDDPATQAAWERGRKGFKGEEPPMVTRIGEYIRYFGSLWVRAYKHLPRTPQFADAHAYLRQVSAAPTVATEEVVRYLHDLTRGLNEADLQIFTKKIVMDDLQHDVANGLEIPIFRDYDDFTKEYGKIEAAMKDRPDLMKRVHKRRRYVRNVAKQMVEAGMLKETDAANPTYFHHAVLDYAPASKAFGGGKKLKKPTLYRRAGTKLDINTKLVEAESEWLFRALTGVATMKAIDKIGGRYDRSKEIKERIRATNKAGVDGLLERELGMARQTVRAPEGVPLSDLSAEQLIQIRDARPIHTKLQEYKRNVANGMRSLREDTSLRASAVPKHLREALAAIQDRNPDGTGEISFELVAWIAQNLDTPGAAGAATVMKNVASRRQFLKDTVGDSYMQPQDLDGAIKAFGMEGQTTWQPDEGRLMFMAKTIPEHVMQRFTEHLANNMGEQSSHFTNEEMAALLATVKDQYILGGKKPQMVLPQELVSTIEEMGGGVEIGPINQIFSRVVRLHKMWLLVSPRSWFRYNLQNITSDIDAALATFPSSLRLKKYMGPAIRELWDVQIKRGEPSAAYLEAAERGVFDAGWSINEVYEAEANIGDVMNTRNFTEKNMRRVWRFFSRSTTFRENWLRYSMYMALRDKIMAAEGQNPDAAPDIIMPMVGYGGAKAEIVDATKDPLDRAALIARESIGDYGEISVAGEYLRGRWLWFWSWQEINFKRYFRLGQNIWLTQRGFGRAQALSGLGAKIGIRSAMWMAFRAGIFFGAVQIWNHMLFPEEEDELSEEDRLRLHIILGRAPDGKVVSLKMPGALSDFLGVFGYEDIAQYVSAVQSGRGNVGDLLETIALSPINRVVGGVTPILKVPMEVMTGQTTMPRFWEMRGLKDPWRHAFRTFKLEHEYDAILGRPTRGYADSWIEAIVTRRDPGENAYHFVRGLGYDWNETVKGSSYQGGAFNERSRNLYYYRKSIQVGDKDAAAHFRKRLREIGVKGEAMRSSLRNMHPLGMLAKRDKRRFLKTLTAEERRRFKRAVGWYNQTFR